VVFEDGLPKRGDYRRFEVKGVLGQDDFASMEEVLRRRFARLVTEGGDAGEAPAGKRRRSGRFAYPPSLLVADGGRGHPAVARRRTASVGEIEQTPGIGPGLARTIYEHLHGARASAEPPTPTELVAAARRAG